MLYTMLKRLESFRSVLFRNSRTTCRSPPSLLQRHSVAMKTLVLCCVCLLAGVGEAVWSTPPPPTVEELSETLQHAYEAYTKKAIQATTGDEVSTLKSRVATLARQLVMQQLVVEERVRSDGDSGVKQER